MPTYTRKVATVEARQYEGPDLIVMSDAQGEQVAKSGDFLVGTEAKKVTVWAKDKFLAEFELLEVAAAEIAEIEVDPLAKTSGDGLDAGDWTTSGNGTDYPASAETYVSYAVATQQVDALMPAASDPSTESATETTETHE